MIAYTRMGSIIFLVGLTLPRCGLQYRTPALTGTVGNAQKVLNKKGSPIKIGIASSRM